MVNKRLSQVRSDLSMLDQTKAQLKIQQMAFVLIAVTILFVLVGMFVLGFKFSGLKKSVTSLCEENAKLLVSKLANSPEFSCGLSFDETKLACVDADKVMVLKENIGSYTNFWGVANIEIRKIYPIEQDVECNMVNYPNCNSIKLTLGGVQGVGTSNFISLCRKEAYGGDIYDKCELARFIVSYDKKC